MQLYLRLWLFVVIAKLITLGRLAGAIILDVHFQATLA